MDRKLSRRMKWSGVVMLLATAICWQPAHGQDLKSFEQRITTKVLPNGLTLIVCERPEAPVFSYSVFIDAGDVNDPSGQSGLAHMFEHLAFKGTTEIGTTDYAAEKVALAKGGGGEQRLRGRIPEARRPRSSKAGGAEKGASGSRGRSTQICHSEPVHRDCRAERRP